MEVVRVRDIGLCDADDPTVLAWAAEQRPVLVTHRAETVTGFAFERLDADLSMPGIIEIVVSAPIGKAVEGPVLILECLADGELRDQVLCLSPGADHGFASGGIWEKQATRQSQRRSSGFFCNTL